MSARIILGTLAFFMFMVTQMIRSSLYIAIEGMFENKSSGLDVYFSETKIPSWTSQERGIVLGAFYASYWITELPGGLLAHRYGGRTVLGIGVFCSGVAALVLPFACMLDPLAAAATRVVQGLAVGVTWPAMHCLAGRWIPKSDRGKFMTTYHGAALGNALTFPLGGILVEQLGWSYALSVPGILCLVWCIFWWRFVFDGPDSHPRISDKEKTYLRKVLPEMNSQLKRNPMPPWLSVLTCGPFWAVLFASIGLMWGSITLSMQLPSYMKQMHQLDIQTNGLLLGLPEVCKFLFSLLYSAIMDKCMKKELLSTTTIRKISVTTCSLIPGILLLVLAWHGENIYIGITLLILGIMAGGASSSGSLANIVDISPTYAGTLLGMIKTLCVLPGVLSPMLVSYIIPSHDEEHLDGWKVIFGITAIIYLFSCVIFIIFGSGEEQKWSKQNVKLDETENVPELRDLIHEQNTVNTRK